MAQDQFTPKLGRIKDARRARALRFSAQVFRETARHGRGALRQHGHIARDAVHRGRGTGVRAAAGLIAAGSRRVIVKARYTRVAGGGLPAAQAHLRYIQRDGVTPEGARGQLYDRDRDGVDGAAFLERSERDPHQFRFVVSADDSARLHDLKRKRSPNALDQPLTPAGFQFQGSSSSSLAAGCPSTMRVRTSVR